VAGVGAEGRLARGIDGGWRRLPRRFGENGEQGIGFGNTRTWEVHCGLVKLLEWLAGGERERVHELKAAAAMAGARQGWRAEGRKAGFYRRSWGSWMTAV
jgi:hypothetical protein